MIISIPCQIVNARREAVDALYPQRDSGIRQLRPALEHAKGLAVRVVEEGGLLVTRRQVQGGKHDPCWYLDLSNMTFQSARDFHHHSTLVRLALFVRDAWAQRVKAAQSLVVVGPPDAHDVCHVVAVRKGQQAGAFQNNPLAIPFQVRPGRQYVSESDVCSCIRAWSHEPGGAFAGSLRDDYEFVRYGRQAKERAEGENKLKVLHCVRLLDKDHTVAYGVGQMRLDLCLCVLYLQLSTSAGLNSDGEL